MRSGTFYPKVYKEASVIFWFCEFVMSVFFNIFEMLYIIRMIIIAKIKNDVRAPKFV